MSYAASFEQQLQQIAKNYKLRGETCEAAKYGIQQAAEARQRIIMAASGEYADSVYAVRADEMLDQFFKQIDRKCGGCAPSRGKRSRKKGR